MKRFLLLATFACAAIFTACDKYDDTQVWEKLNDHEKRIVKLEELCAHMNTNIAALQTIVDALQHNDYVTGITPVKKDGKEIGYTINFTQSSPITIYHGQDGTDGTDGKDGKDGKDGHTPIIGVKQHTDGIYYWTLDGDWLLDANGNKIKAVGTDGKDGADGEDGAPGSNGKDGITPQLKIEDDYWFVSYDNGASWTRLNKATSDGGASGTTGDSMFQSVTQDENNVYFKLADGTTITIPKVASVENIELTYIPRYSDGKATVFYTEKSDSYVEIDFEVSPASAAADWKDIATVKAVYTETRADVEFVDMDIVEWTTNTENGTITIKASGENLNDAFFAGEQEASVRLVVKGDNLNIISDYIPMVAKSIAQPNNEIWYTSIDGNIVMPNKADAFGAEIVSNTYKDGKGVIVFNGDIVTIGVEAFLDCANLEGIKIPNSVIEIGGDTFRNCSNLKSITIPDSVTSIGSSAFNRCSGLTSIIIPKGLTRIDFATFSSCGNLTNVVIPEGVTEIGSAAFAGCISLTSITMPDSVVDVVGDAFSDCNSLEAFYGELASDDNRCLIIDGVLVSFASAGLTSYSIPSEVSAIEDFVFAGCSKLASINIPNSVTEIGNSAFRYCSGLTSVTIPSSVKKIGDQALYECTSLKSVYCKSTTPPVLSLTSEAFGGEATDRKIYVPHKSFDAYKTADGWKEYADALVKYDFDTNSIVPDVPEPTEPAANEIWYTSTNGSVVKPYDTEAFNEATIVSNTYGNGRGVITFSKDLTDIGDYAFSRCKGFKSVILPKSVKTLGISAFAECSNLESIILPEDLTTLGISAFSDCVSLTSITIPGVKEIGGSAFAFCSSLTEIIISDGVRIIGDSAFAVCTSLTEITITDGVTTLDNSVFASCRNLKDVDIPNSVTSFGSSVFYNCSGLTSISIPNGVQTMGVRVFQNCRNLKAFYGKFASADNKALVVNGVLNSFAAGCGATSYTIPSGVTEIEGYAFYGCSTLTSVVIPNGVTVIRGDAFSNCSDLKSVTVPDSVTEIKSYAFSGCTSLTDITIPDGVIAVESNTFNSCRALASITIPASVETIGYAAFSGCSSLASVYCKPTTPPTGGSFMFADISSSAKIYVPTGTGATYKATSYWKEYADIIVEKAM